MLLPLLVSVFFGRDRARAGPPFLTDDPEPVASGHWEFYAASQWSLARNAAVGTAPHVEVNYGAVPGLQLHVIVPATLFAKSGEALRYGPGDVELGTKIRFVDEGGWRPQLGTFPLITLPTGSAGRGLGAGSVQGFIPIWIQKSFGAFTTYGGAGLRLASEGRAAVLGWLLQRAVGRKVVVGTEVYFTDPLTGAAGRQVQFNLGLIANFGELHHLLLSAGPSFGNDALMQTYIAYQLTM